MTLLTLPCSFGGECFRYYVIVKKNSNDSPAGFAREILLIL